MVETTDNISTPTLVATVLATDGSKTIPSGTIAMTPGANQPNVVLTIINPVVALLIRFSYAFFTTLVGLVTAAMASNAAGSNVIPAKDFYHLVIACATLSIAGAGVGLLKDIVTIFGRLESKYPLGTGSAGS